MVLLNELFFFRNLDHNQNEMRDDSISASLLSFSVVCVMLNHYYHVLPFLFLLLFTVFKSIESI